MLQNPTDSTELDSSSSFDPLAIPPSTENDPTTLTHTHNAKNTDWKLIKNTYKESDNNWMMFLSCSCFSMCHRRPPCPWRCWWVWRSRPLNPSSPESRPCCTRGRSAPPGVRPDLMDGTKPNNSGVYFLRYPSYSQILNGTTDTVCIVDHVWVLKSLLKILFPKTDSYIICLHWLYFCCSCRFIGP